VINGISAHSLRDRSWANRSEIAVMTLKPPPEHPPF
jgi:hypothetical protein